MGRPVIYLHTEQSYYLNDPKVTIRDICSVYCKDRNVQNKINGIEIYRFKEKEDGRAFMSILILIQAIAEAVPEAEIKNVGEEDFVIYYRDPQQQPARWLQRGKILLICITCFLGMGISIMGYNNDVDMSRVFAQLYETFLGREPDGPTFVELFYSIGLTVGIFLFFNHTPGKKVTNEPTPIQVQMRLYERDVNQTFLLGASRKGEELDADNDC